MKCSHCGAELREGAKFCDSCGEKVGEGIPEGAASQDAGAQGATMQDAQPQGMASQDAEPPVAIPVAPSDAELGENPIATPATVPAITAPVVGGSSAGDAASAGAGSPIGMAPAGGKPPMNKKKKTILIVVIVVVVLILLCAVSTCATSSNKSDSSSDSSTTSTTDTQADSTSSNQTPEQQPTVNKSKLKTALATQSTYAASDYTADSYAAFQQAIMAGQQLYDSSDATQEQVDAATQSITEAASGLVSITADRANYRSDVSYENLARTPDDFKAQYVTLSGKVVQVMEGTGETDLRVAIDDDYDQMVLVAYDPSIMSERILEDDEITFYGKSLGTTSYTSTLGAKITVPAIWSYIIDIG